MDKVPHHKHSAGSGLDTDIDLRLIQGRPKNHLLLFAERGKERQSNGPDVDGAARATGQENGAVSLQEVRDQALIQNLELLVCHGHTG